MNIMRNLCRALVAAGLAAPIQASAYNPLTPGQARIDRGDLQVVSRGDERVNLNFRLQDLTQSEVWSGSERFDRFSIGEAPSAGGEGWPDLPALTRFVLIPPQSGVTLRLTNVRSRIVEDVDIPGTPAMTLETNEPPAETPSILPTVQYDGFWPSEIAELGTPAVMRGYRLVPVTIHPLRYNQLTRQLEIIEDFDVELTFPNNPDAVNPAKSLRNRKPSRAVNRIIESLVVNPSPDLTRDEPTEGGSIVYVVGRGGGWDQAVQNLQPLIEWRRKCGWKAEMIRAENPTSASEIKEQLIEAYENWDPPPEHIVLVGDANVDARLGTFDVRRNAGYPYESDHPFGCLEGDDVLPEASVSRIAWDSPNILRDIVSKIVQYESDPYLGEGNRAGWQKRGLVLATDFRSGLSTIDVSRWSRQVMLTHGYDRVDELYYEGERNADPSNAIVNSLSNGVSLLTYRGWQFLNGFSFQAVPNLNNGRLLPLVILATCNTNDFAETLSDQYYYCDRFLRHPNGGAIAALGASGANHTPYNNLIVSGTVDALLNQGLTEVGWATMVGKMAIYANYAGRDDIVHPENGGDAWFTSMMIFNLMGDPATDLFTGVPRRLRLEAPEIVGAGESHLEATLLYADDDTPVSDVKVCFYKPDGFQHVSYTDDDGRVVFDFDPTESLEGTAYLTASGHNLFPVSIEYDLTRQEYYVGASTFAIDDDADGASSGNGDGFAGQGETIELGLMILNSGEERPEGALDVSLATNHPHLEVVNGEARLDEAPEPNGRVEVSFLVRIGAAFRSKETAVFDLVCTAGERSWQSSVSFPIFGPRYRLAAYEWQGPPLAHGGEAEMLLTLENFGQLNGPQLTSRLISLDERVGVTVESSDFPEISAGMTGESQGTFALDASPLLLGGKHTRLALALTDGEIFIDTVFFSIQLAPAGDGDPFGPDAYGYICIDDADSGWFEPPVYRWVELDPTEPRHIQGAERLDLNDREEEGDETTIVDLPFMVRYYNQDFDQLTISTNGWAALGDSRTLLLARNRRMDGVENAPGMLAPFWDDLITPQGSGIFTWSDEDSARFYVEWSQVRRLGPNNANEAQETFQIILHDPEFWPSLSGDADVIFQYQDVSDEQSCFQEYDTPFATVGICSPDLTTGLEYTYWGELAPGASPLEDGRAIRFTTMVEFAQGELAGRVLDAANGNPVEGALIRTTYGFRALTDANGMFIIDNIAVDSAYTVRASKEFYNTASIDDIPITEGEQTFVEFRLLHPEFQVSEPELTFWMLPDSTAERSAVISNNGNGLLTYRSKFVTPDQAGRDDTDEEWRIRRIFSVSDSLFDPYIQSVAFVENSWVVAGGSMVDTVNYFYWFNRELELDSVTLQPVKTRLGFRDMDYFRGVLWCTNSDSSIYRIDPATGALLGYLNTPRPLSTSRAITFDPATGELYIAGITGRIYRYTVGGDRSLEEIRSYLTFDPRVPEESLRKSGLAWWRDDPDGCQLYIYTQNEFPDDLESANISLFKMDVNTGVIRFVTTFPGLFGPGASGAGGSCITTQWDNQIVAFAATVNDAASDKLLIAEIAPNTSWIDYSPPADTIAAGASRELEFTILSSDLDTGVFRTVVRFDMNAQPGRFFLPVTMNVVDVLPDLTLDDARDLPGEFALGQNYPNPFNGLTLLRFSLPAAGVARLIVYDLSGREVTRLLDDKLPAGSHGIVWDAFDSPAGIYFARLEAEGRTATRKLILLK